MKTEDYQATAVREFMVQAKQDCPLAPTMPSFEVRQLRARIILEEALETINKGLGFDVFHRGQPIDTENLMLVYRAHGFDLIELADGCADLKVVTVGTEIACGINGKPVFDEVMRSNMTKFIDGHRREDGKWIKGPSYSPANLKPIIESQIQ